MRKTLLLLLTITHSVIFFAQTCHNETVFTGEGTYYDLSSSAVGGLGNCSFDHSIISPFYIGAMNAVQYGDADYCGACAEVTGPIGTVVVKIIDQCPECAHGDIDLSPEAFDQIANRIDGRVNISWKVVPCPINSNIKFYYKDGSNQWWTAVQVRDHRYPITKLEVLTGAGYVSAPRQDYNFFLKADGMGPGPHTFRITDVYGETVVATDIDFEPEVEKVTDVQFPECTVTSINYESKENASFSIKEGIIEFENLEGRYELINLSGKVLLNGITNDRVDLNYYTSGVYFLKVEENGRLITRRIIL